MFQIYFSFVPAGQSEDKIRDHLRLLGLLQISALHITVLITHTHTVESVCLLENLINRMLIYFPEGLCAFVPLFASFLLICLSLHFDVTSSLSSSKASLRWASSSSSQTKHFSASYHLLFNTLSQRFSASQWTDGQLHSHFSMTTLRTSTTTSTVLAVFYSSGTTIGTTTTTLVLLILVCFTD